MTKERRLAGRGGEATRTGVHRGSDESSDGGKDINLNLAHLQKTTSSSILSRVTHVVPRARA